MRSKNREPGLGSRNRIGNELERSIAVNVSMKSTIGGWPKSGTSGKRHAKERGSEIESGKENGLAKEKEIEIDLIGTGRGLGRENAIDLWTGITAVASWIVAGTEEDAGQWKEVDETVQGIVSEGVAAAGIVIGTTETVVVDVMDEITAEVEVGANRKMTSTRIPSVRA